MVKEYKKIHGLIRLQPVSTSIDEDLTVLQHMYIFARLAGIPLGLQASQVDEMLKACQLSEIKDKKAGELTLGH